MYKCIKRKQLLALECKSNSQFLHVAPLSDWNAVQSFTAQRVQITVGHKRFSGLHLVNKEASLHKMANHDFPFPFTPSTNQPRRHRCSKNIGPKWRTASFRLRLGDSEENHPKWPHCQDAIPKQWWLHWIPQTWTFIPKILEVVFFTTRRKATRFAAWFVLTYWCYIVCFFLQMRC